MIIYFTFLEFIMSTVKRNFILLTITLFVILVYITFWFYFPFGVKKNDRDSILKKDVSPLGDDVIVGITRLIDYDQIDEAMESLTLKKKNIDREREIADMKADVFIREKIEQSISQQKTSEIQSQPVIIPKPVVQKQKSQVEVQRIAQEQAAQAEAQRIAQEQAAQAETQRIAQEQAAQVEAQRIAQEQAAQAEAQRIAQQKAAQAEADRIAQEQAAQAEADRLAQEQAAKNSRKSRRS